MTDYDRVEYPSRPFPQCHPDRLAIMARLFGRTPPPVATCRVLEIGCGDGLNLLASAVVLPEARFVGIDLSRAAIRRGRRLARDLGLGNVRLVARDLRALPVRGERFDYVVAHGLYSWLPAELRERLLAAIRGVLQPQGVAFVSYNAYPGAYLRRMVREMAGLLAEVAPSPAGARAWLERAPRFEDGPPLYRAVVADEAADMLRRDDGALFHDDLAAVNEPCWFSEFMARAATHDLQYVAEAEMSTTGCAGLTAAGTSEALAFAAGERLRLEQYADALRGRRFRQTLLCHAGQRVRLEPDAQALRGCFAGGPINPGAPGPDDDFVYTSRTGGRYSTAEVGERTILESVAAAWPAYLPVNRFGQSALPAFLKLFSAGMLDLRTLAPPVATGRTARPRASSLARAQALRGAPLTSLHHLEIFIGSESLRAVLALADGTRTRGRIAKELGALYPSEPGEKVARAADQHLEELRQYGLLSS